jgi:hypothetical protein
MTDTNVRKVQRWLRENSELLSLMFPELHLHLMEALDPARGKITLQLNGPSAGASITFWNKGDVEALVLDKLSGKNQSLDDRVLAPDEDIGALLQSYTQTMASLLQSGGRPGL